jgi:hypothetical protein
MDSQLDIIRAVRTGYAAYEALSRDQTAHVMGVTSCGVFVWLDAGPVVFVSAEPYAGPLTIVLPGGWRSAYCVLRSAYCPLPGAVDSLRVGSPALVRSGQLVLPDVGLVISAAAEDVWRAPPVAARLAPLSARLDTLHGLARAALASGRDLGLGAWLPHLLETEVGRSGAGSQEPIRTFVRYEWIKMSVPLPLDLQSSGVAATVAVDCKSTASMGRIPFSQQSGRLSPYSLLPTPCSLLLGKGRGLTPSGDDVVIGLLLAINRWQAASWEAEHLARFNRAVVEAAYGKTTRLSANLIECAARGEADERLIGLVDGVFGGAPDQATCAAYMLGWGGSSGIDALVGIALAVVTGRTLDIWEHSRDQGVDQALSEAALAPERAVVQGAGLPVHRVRSG